VTRPAEFPGPVDRRRKQRVGERIAVQVGGKIDDQQTVVQVIVGEEAERKRMRREDRAVDAARALQLKRLVLTAKLQEIAMERVLRRVCFALLQIELAPGERVGIRRRVERCAPFEIADARKLRQEFSAPFSDGFRQLPIEIREVQKWRRRGEFLSLK